MTDSRDRPTTLDSRQSDSEFSKWLANYVESGRMSEAQEERQMDKATERFQKEIAAAFIGVALGIGLFGFAVISGVKALEWAGFLPSHEDRVKAQIEQGYVRAYP